MYARLQIVIELYATLAKLGHIKFGHPACISADGGHFDHTMWTVRKPQGEFFWLTLYRVGQKVTPNSLHIYIFNIL